MSEPRPNGPPTFRFFEYRIAHDLFGWEEHNRASLVASVAGKALASCYGPGVPRMDRPVLKRSVLIRRALADDFDPAESEAILRAWAALWLPQSDTPHTFLERHGILDLAVNLDLSPLDPRTRVDLERQPDEAEVKDALAPWVAYWRTLP